MAEASVITMSAIYQDTIDYLKEQMWKICGIPKSAIEDSDNSPHISQLSRYSDEKYHDTLLRMEVHQWLEGQYLKYKILTIEHML